MEIIEVDINELKPSEYNPRAMTTKEAKDLGESLMQFDLVEPLVVNKGKGRENVIIGGHQRYFILKEMGRKTIPVVYVDLPDIEKERELNLRLNKNLGHWDWEALANFDEEFLKNVGFISDELDRVFKGIEDDNFVEEEILNPVSVLGEVYQLGRHKLMCADSTKLENWQKLMGSEKAQLIYTDPPYNVNYDYTVTYGEGKARKNKLHTFSDTKSDEDMIAFIRDVFKNMYEVTDDSNSFYCWHASKTDHLFKQGLKEAGYHISVTLYWLKNIATFHRGLDYLWITEPCYFGWKKKKKHWVNRQYIFQFKNIETMGMDDFGQLMNVIYQNRDLISEYEHPTQKPIPLAQRPIIRHSKRDDIVIDAFGGSGSTIFACEQLNRRCYTMELDPVYCDIIRKRYARFIGKEVEWQTITPKIS